MKLLLLYRLYEMKMIIRLKVNVNISNHSLKELYICACLGIQMIRFSSVTVIYDQLNEKKSLGALLNSYIINSKSIISSSGCIMNYATIVLSTLNQ